MRISVLFLVVCFLIPVFVMAQDKETDYARQAWFAYNNQTRLTDRSGIWLDVHLRLNDNFVKEPSASIFRGAYLFYLNDNHRLAAGYAYVTQYANAPGVPNTPEHRLWQQIQWFERKNWLSLMQWVRLEERFRRKVEGNELVAGYNFNYRVRHAMALTIPLKGKTTVAGTPFVFINNEVMVNFGPQIVNNYFDQNRLFLGLGYQFTPQLNAHLGYLNVFQQLPAPGAFRQVDAFRLFVFHNLDFRSND